MPAAPVFIAYVDLAVIVGRFVDSNLKAQSVEAQISQTGQALCEWMQSLDSNLRLSSSAAGASSPAHFDIQQLHVTYYAVVAMLYRARNSDDPLPTVAVLAGSTIAGIFEELLARDQVRHLGPVYTFYLLVASIALLSCYKYPNLWPVAQEDLRIISQAQEEMKKKWGSALGSIRSFDRMYEVTTNTQSIRASHPPATIDAPQALLLQDVPSVSCRLWEALQVEPTMLSLGNLLPTNRFQMANSEMDTLAQSRPQTLSHGLSATASGQLTIQGPLPYAPTDQLPTWPTDETFFGEYLFWDDLTMDPV
jgi:hypothetical protein